MIFDTGKLLRLAALAALLGLPAGRSSSAAIGPPDFLFPYQWVGNIDQIDLNEPSGIVLHPSRGTLFVVGDNGDICEIRRDGTLVKEKHLAKADFEGITCDPSTGLLYIAVEGDEKIIEVDPEDFAIAREWPIARTFQGKALLKAGDSGLEGIAFAPDPGHPHGGTFYVVNQGFDLAATEDISAIFEVEVPLRSSAPKDPTAKIVKYFAIGIIDLAGLWYDSATDRLLVVSDATNAFFEVARTGAILKSYAFPGANQEGIALDPEGFLYIAQDSGGIIKIKWLREK